MKKLKVISPTTPLAPPARSRLKLQRETIAIIGVATSIRAGGLEGRLRAVNRDDLLARATVATALLLIAGLSACGGQGARPQGAGRTQQPVSRDAGGTLESGVVELIHGTQVADPFRWMESPQQADAFRRWIEPRARRTQAALDAIPGRSALREVIARAEAGVQMRLLPSVENGVIAFVDQGPGDALPTLRVRLGATERVLIDAARLQQWNSDSIDLVSLSPDAKYAAVGISRQGNEDITVRVVDVATGRVLPDVVPHVVPYPLAWLRHGGGFIACRRDFDPATRPEKERKKGANAYLHRFSGGQDELVMGPGYPGLDDFTDIDASMVMVSPDSSQIVGIRQRGVDQHISLYTRPLADVGRRSAAWKRIVDTKAGVTEVVLLKDKAYAIADRDAATRILVEYDLARGEERELHRPERGLLERIARSDEHVYLAARNGNESQLFRYAPLQKRITKLDVKGNRAVTGLVGGAGRKAMVQLESWTQGPRWHELDHRTTGVREIWPDDTGARFDNLNVETLRATAPDGVMVPVTWIASPTHSPSSPVWMFAYGAYGESLQPKFLPFLRGWFEHGGAIAYAHVRGGGEFGEAWHLGGKAEKKPTAVSDFVSCAEMLIATGHARAGRLVASAGSAGGVTVGRAAVNRPELFSAVILSSALLNPLRHEQTPTGAGNVSEFGSTANPVEFRSLLAVDPYAAIERGIHYPAFLLMVGMNDARVPVWQSAKFAARLEESGSPESVLLRTDTDSGHATSQARRIEKSLDMMSFLLWKSGDPAFQPPK